MNILLKLLFTLLLAFGPPLPAISSALSLNPTLFGYDGRVAASISYEETTQQTFDYDSVAPPFANEARNRIALTSACSVSFTQFLAAKTGANAAEGLATQPNRIYSARELIRRAEESGPFHNFPESFNQQIFENGTRTVTPNYFKVPKPGLSQDGVMYQLRGSVNGVNGTFEIGVRPSVSGNTEVIGHRFFRPDP